MSKLLEQIPLMTDQELENLYVNIATFIMKHEESVYVDNVALGKKNLAAVISEIERRGALAAKGEYKPDTRDDEGILAMMGYRVGKRNGVQTKVRRIILDRIVNGPLPPIPNLAYLHDWSEPGTSKRLSKIARTICFFIIKNKSFNDENYEQAIAEWHDDMEWLKKTYYDPKQYTFKWPDIRS